MLPCTSRRSTTRTPREVNSRKSTWKPPPIPSGTSTSMTWSDPVAVTAIRNDLRWLYCRYQRHSHETPNPSPAAAAMRTQAVGGSFSISSTSTTLRHPAIPQRVAERCQVGVDLGTLGRSGKQFCQRFRHGDVAADQRRDDLAELGRMGGGDQHPAACSAAFRGKPRIRLRGSGRVRAPDLAEFLVTRADARTNGLVIHGLSAHRGADLAQLRIERTQALHVAGVADVHGGCKRGDAGARTPVPRGEKIRHGAVGVVRQHHLGDRQPEAPGPDAGHRVAEVAARNDEGRPLAVASEYGETRRGVVHGLRQQPPQIDAVGGGERPLLLPPAVEECLLDEPLTVIERTAHREGADVAAPTGELPLLRG